jgi:hypothetical protein
MTVVGGIQASTVTRVAFGDWRRFASFMTQMAMNSQMARKISQIKQKPPKIAAIPAAVALSISGVALATAAASSGDEVCAKRVVVVTSNGRPEMNRFIMA